MVSWWRYTMSIGYLVVQFRLLTCSITSVTFVFFLTQIFGFLSRHVVFNILSWFVRLLACSLLDRPHQHIYVQLIQHQRYVARPSVTWRPSTSPNIHKNVHWCIRCVFNTFLLSFARANLVCKLTTLQVDNIETHVTGFWRRGQPI